MVTEVRHLQSKANLSEMNYTYYAPVSDIASSTCSVVHILSYWTCCSELNGPDFWSGGARFEFRSRHRLSWLKFFVVFPRHSQNSGAVPQLVQSHFRPNHPQFIIHVPFLLCILLCVIRKIYNGTVYKNRNSEKDKIGTTVSTFVY
jgi:hypothetical protein